MKIISYVFFILLLFLSCKEASVRQKITVKGQTENITGKQIVDSLNFLGFFKLTNKTEVERAKADIAKTYDDLHFFEGTPSGDSMEFINNRFYSIDCEELFEAGGITMYLKEVKTSFDKLGLQLEFKNEKTVQDGNSITHTIEINGREYTAFNGVFSGKDWVKAYINFIGILNDELKLQRSDEQFYPIRCENDGRIVLLTVKQFQLIKKYYPDDNEHPKTLQNWKMNNDL